MICLAELLASPVSGYSPVEVEGRSNGKTSCSAMRGACECGIAGAVLRYPSAPDRLLCSSLSAAPWLMPLVMSSSASWVGLPKPSCRQFV